MVSQNKRIDKLEDAHTALAGVVSKHLEESGEIRADLRWLKKAVYFMVSSPILVEVVRHIWS